ncbi:MAG: hypothetical protein HYX87_04265 [Chloroflexi bacterium]|nr:hypothetical protein [Chloroflexota bacterium]
MSQLKRSDVAKVKPFYEVVSPQGAVAKASQAGARNGVGVRAAALPGLEAKKIGLIWTRFPNGDVVLRAFQRLLADRFKTIQFVDLPPGRGLKWGDYAQRSVADVAREAGVDAVIVTIGG